MKKKILLSLLALIFIACSGDGIDGNANQAIGGDGQGGSLARFTLVGDYLYTVDDQSLRIFNIQNPSLPTYVNNRYIGREIETLFSLDDYLFIGSRLGMFIYDISDRENPLELSSVSHFRSCDPVVSSGDYTYVTLHTNAACIGELNQLEIYDTTDPFNPVQLQVVQMDRPIGLGLYNEFLFVTDENVVRIFDVTNPALPDLVGGIPVDAFDVIIRANQIYVIGPDALYQYALDPNNITNYTEMSTITF